jgi:uncharacterized protein (TIGR03437 family)
MVDAICADDQNFSSSAPLAMMRLTKFSLWTLIFALVSVAVSGLWLAEQKSDASVSTFPPAAASTPRQKPSSTVNPHRQTSRTKRGSRLVLPAATLQKLDRKRKTANAKDRYDQPQEAAAFHRMKRVPVGEDELPVERYLTAQEHLRQMPRYASALQTSLSAPPAAESALEGQWESLGPGNIGGRTRTLLIHPTTPDIMYAAGVAGGVWKSVNAGASWTPLTDLMANLAVCSLAFDPQNPATLYAGTGEGFFNGNAVRGAGIFKTTDAGANWTRLPSTNTSDFHYVNDLVISAADSNRMYAATRTGVWRSLDGGANWTLVISGKGGCFDLVMRTDQVTDTVFAVVGSNQQTSIYRNTDAGGSGAWGVVQTESGMGRTSLALSPSNQNVIYALAAETQGQFQSGLRAVFRSTSGGDAGSWTTQVRNTDAKKLNTVLLSNPLAAFLSECGAGSSFFISQGWYNNVIAVDPVDANRIWVGGVDLFRSDDGGANWGLASYWWEEPTAKQYVHADQHVIAFHPRYDGVNQKQMFVGNDGGIFRTADATGAVASGSSSACDPTISKVVWQSLNHNYGVTQFYHGLPFPDGQSYFGGTQDNGTLLGTMQAGNNGWREILGGDGGYVAVDPMNPRTLYAENTYLSLRKSTNGGQTFGRATWGIDDPPGSFQFITPFVMDPSDPQRLWIGGTSLFRTTNGAANWSKASALFGNGVVSAIAVASTNANYVAAGTSQGQVYLTDVGLTATSNTQWFNSAPRSGYVSSVTFDPVNPLTVYVTYSTFGGRHLWRSLDFGASWSPLDGVGDASLPDIPVHQVVVDPGDPARLYVGTDLGVFVSTNGGTSWAVENTGFANVVTESLSLLTIDGVTSLYAFTHGRGAYRVVINRQGCQYTLSATGTTVAQSGGAGSVDVSGTPNRCSWDARSNAGWISVTTAQGKVNYTVKANDQLLARVGTITIAGRCFTISQPGNSSKEDRELPTLQILTPTTASHYQAQTPTLTLSGTANDDAGLAQITWANDRGAASGIASGTNRWTAQNIPLLAGMNRLAITARDVRGKTRSVILNVFFNATPTLLTLSTNGYHGTTGLVMDKSGNLYFTSAGAKVVSKLDNKTGAITRYVGGGTAQVANGIAATSVFLLSPFGLAMDAAENLYVSDADNRQIYKITPDGKLYIVAGVFQAAGFNGDNRPATEAWLNRPRGIAVDQVGNVYVADSGNYRIRKIQASDGIISTIAGNGTQGRSGNGGPALDAQIMEAYGLAIDKQGQVYFADINDYSIRRISRQGTIDRVAGTGVHGFNGSGRLAKETQVDGASNVCVDAQDNFWFTDASRIYKVDVASGILQTIVGGGAGNSADGVYAPSVRLSPGGAAVTMDANGNPVFAEGTRLRKAVPFTLHHVPPPTLQLFSSDMTITSNTGFGVGGQADFANITHISFSNDRGGNGEIRGNLPSSSSWLAYPEILPGLNNLTFTAWDVLGRSSSVSLKITYNPGTITKTIAGTGTPDFTENTPPSLTSLWNPEGLAMDAAGNLYVADSGNHRIRKITMSGVVTTVAGNGQVGSAIESGFATTVALNQPRGVAMDAAGNLYISDTNNHRVCRITPDGMLRTIAGSGQSGLSGDGGSALAAKLNEPTSLVVNEEALFIVEAQNYRVRKVDLRTGIISTYAGSTPGDAGDGGPATAAKFRQPSGVALDKAGNLYISDLQTSRIRRVSLDGKITTYASYFAAGINADVTSPSGLVMDSNDNLYVVSQSQSSVARITPQGTATNIPFFGNLMQKPDADWPKTFRNPTGVAVDRGGTVYVADTLNHRIVAALDFKQAVSVSAASYQGSTSSDESIVSVFGQALATTTEASTTLPLPTTLGGTRVLVRDSAGIERAAPLFYVSPFQINYLVPPGTSSGVATVTIQSAAQVTSTGTLQIQSVSPALFAANQDGAGAASLAILRFKSDGRRQYEPSLQWNSTRTRLIPLPIDLSPAGDEVFLELYGTGIRGHQGNVRAYVGGETVPVLYAGVAPGYVGLDQVNLSLPRSLIGRGEATLQLFVDGVATNPVTIHIGGTMCSATLSSLTSAFGSAGGTGSLNLSLASGCAWAAQSQDDWIQITSPAQGAGNGVITFSVTPNASPNARQGTVRIAGQVVQVTQAGFAAPNAPVVTFTAPTNGASYETSVPFLTLRGTITSAAGVSYIVWSNDRGGRGVINAATDWNLNNYQLPAGRTVFTVTAYDQLGRVGHASLIVQHNPLYVYTVAGGGTKPVEDGAVATTVALASANYAIDQDGTVFLGGTGKIHKINADGTLATVLAKPELPSFDGMILDRFSNVYVGSTRALTYRINLKSGAVTEYGLTMRPFCTDEQGQVYLGGLTNLGGMRIVRLNPETRQLTTIAGGGSYTNPDNPKDYGDGKLATDVRLSLLSGVVLDRAGNLYLAEAFANRIRKVDAQTGIITTFLGAAGSSIIEPTHPIALGNLGGLHFDAVFNRLYFLSRDLPTRIYQLDFTTGRLAAIAGSASGPVADEGRLATEILLDPATNFQTDKQGILYLGEGNNNRIRKLSPVP